MNRVIFLFLCLAAAALAQDRFTSSDGLSHFTPTIEAPKSDFCPEGSWIPVEATFAKGKISGVKFWKQTNIGWLFDSKAKAVIQKAIQYVATGKPLFGAKDQSVKAIIRVPCTHYEKGREE